MKRLILVAVLLFGLAAPAWGGFEEGLDAYNEGDYATALKEFLPLAEQGNTDAQVKLGYMYELGRGVPQDYNEAVKWYRQAASQGHAKAQALLGNMYAKGEGVPQNYPEAMKWWRKAAEQGYAPAQVILGNMYAKGQGVPRDDREAAKWHRKAAEQGYADAYGMLGIPYCQYMNIIDQYLYGPKRYGFYKGHEAWKAVTEDDSVNLFIVGQLENPNWLVLIIKESKQQETVRTSIILHQLLANVAPDWPYRVDWVRHSRIRLGANPDCDRQISICGVTITMSYNSFSCLIKVVIMNDPSNDQEEK